MRGSWGVRPSIHGRATGVDGLFSEHASEPILTAMADEAPEIVVLILFEGSRQGPVLARLDGYVNRALSFARTDWYRVLDHGQLRPLLDQVGVYVLVGPREQAPQEQVYIGQADRLG